MIRDPRERHNLAVLHPELTARFRQLLRPQLLALLHTGQGNAARELSPEEIQSLRALGYAR
ncbi:MAG TPA: hypothetical protein VGV61_10830 [Thermoanaerobaculia bacterium]|nr:hypothetical protein [Thermoanaerobaculia bacterium]